MTRLDRILRYPLKSHSREALASVVLEAGTSMPWDRIWAVAHDAAKIDPGKWAPCVHFSRVTKAPALMAITSRLDEETETLTLSHPDRPDLTFRPDSEEQRLIDWIMPLVPQNRALPTRIVRLEGRGFTDSDFPSVTLCNMATHRAVEEKAGQPLSIHRWRGNLWFDNQNAWSERDWIGKDLAIGACILRPREQTERCLATTTNPDNGVRDIDVLGLLDGFGHRDFSVRAEVIRGGEIAVGDPVVLI